MRPDRSVAGTGLQSRSPLRLAVHPRGDSLQRATRSPRLGQQRDEAVPRLLGRLCKASAQLPQSGAGYGTSKLRSVITGAIFAPQITRIFSGQESFDRLHSLGLGYADCGH